MHDHVAADPAELAPLPDLDSSGRRRTPRRDLGPQAIGRVCGTDPRGRPYRRRPGQYVHGRPDA
ncbi:hypothetical protein PJO52_14750 [Mycobacterium kansasii]